MVDLKLREQLESILTKIVLISLAINGLYEDRVVIDALMLELSEVEDRLNKIIDDSSKEELKCNINS